MRPLLLLVAASAIAIPAVAGCGGSTGASSAAHPAEVRITHVHVAGSGYAVEGSYSYVRVDQPDGAKATEERLSLADPPTASLRVDPGSYRIVSYQRNCDGTCTRLDPPSDFCSRPVDVAPGATIELTIRLRPGQGCTFAPTS
ncbi:MAG: hypothetical protein ACJ77E_04110 [Gaiellaceae bacterium]